MPAHTHFGQASQQQCILDVLVAASNKLHACNMSGANTLAARVLPLRCRPTTEILCTTSHTTARALPPPLTETALSEAYTQLTPGAEKSIKTLVQWWRTNKLSSHEVLATVQSFSGSSAVLQRIFPPATSESEKEDSQLQSERIRKEFEKRSDRLLQPSPWKCAVKASSMACPGAVKKGTDLPKLQVLVMMHRSTWTLLRRHAAPPALCRLRRSCRSAPWSVRQIHLASPPLKMHQTQRVIRVMRIVSRACPVKH